VSFFRDHGGKHSLTRLLVAVCVPFLVITPLVVWALVCLHKHEVADLPNSVTGYIMGANGIILGYAAHNRRVETKTPPASSATPPAA
jgi:hypothetical protein